MKHCCEQMETQIENGLVLYEERYDDYSLLVRDHGEMMVVQQIWYCPWCAKKLPKSMRHQWFHELEAMDIDPFDDPVPERYKTKEWRS
jgi:hypothetical protein